MSATLPALGREEFGDRLAPFLPCAAGASVESGAEAPAEVPFEVDRERLAERLYAYYEELARWSPRLSLVGEGTASDVVERHFGESLLGLPLLLAGARVLDLGSGAGFPGLVLGAAGGGLRVTLAEARLRKCAFMRSAARKMGLAPEILQIRVGLPLSSKLPCSIDCLTARAVRFPAPVWAALVKRLSAGGQVLLWSGDEAPEIPGLSVVGEVALPSSRRRRIVRYRRP